jgi:hypothetical protein
LNTLLEKNYKKRVKDLHKLCQEAPAGVGYDARAILHLNQNSLVKRNVLSKENKLWQSMTLHS